MPDTQKPHILIIENEEALTIALSDTFNDAGWQTSVARSGEEGLKQANEQHPDLIILDIMLGKITGVEVLKKLRADQDWGANVPIIITTNLSYLENMQEVKGLATDFMYKGNFELDDLVVKIKEILKLDGDDDSFSAPTPDTPPSQEDN